MSTRKRILLLIKLPPPITGATLMNKRVNNSSLINSTFNVRTIKISYAKNVGNLGKIELRKLFIMITTVIV